MTGILAFSDERWLAYHRMRRHTSPCFYGAANKSALANYDHVFFVVKGWPRRLAAVATVDRCDLVHPSEAWAKYGAALGAETETEWEEQAAAVLRNAAQTDEMAVGPLRDLQILNQPRALPNGYVDSRWQNLKSLSASETAAFASCFGLTDAEEGEPQPSLHLGAGFGTSIENQVVEKAAVDFVREKYEADGWVVRSRERDQSVVGYDLECRRAGEELHVEVKGVRGSSPDFMLTAGELRAAQTDPQFEFAVVTEAMSKPVLHRWSGIGFLAEFDAKAVTYRASRKAR